MYVMFQEIMAYSYVTKFAKCGLIHASDFVSLKWHNFIYKRVIRLKFQSYEYNDRTVMIPNFKALGPNLKNWMHV